MKTLSTLLLATLCLMAMPACKTAQKYEQNRLAGEQWLAGYTRSAATNVTGNWHSDEWGGGSLKQTGRIVTGVLGQFDINGVVSGSKVYLLISERGWIFYTAVLDRTSASALSGFYSYSVPFTLRDQRTMQLRKL